DIRFTTKGKILYAIALGWPDDGKFIIKSLAKTNDASMNQIDRVELLGGTGALEFTQTADALTVELPAQKISDLTCALKITGSNLKPVTPLATVMMIRPDAKGIVTLSAADAELHGDQIQLEEKGGLPDIGFWDRAADWVSWKAQIPAAGAYKVSATIATQNAGGNFVVEVGAENLGVQALVTGSWERFQTLDLGQIAIQQPGELLIKVRSKDPASWKAINLNKVQLTPVR
ncbi:MAG: alpha-L-fucosidase C-terminal domain-containing protein, partial [Limisphaerales bacterium]